VEAAAAVLVGAVAGVVVGVDGARVEADEAADAVVTALVGSEVPAV
jgi:hypothetical protein